MDVKLIMEESGEWNISDIMKSDSSSIISEADTLNTAAESKWKFPFNIKINNLSLDQVNLKIKNYVYRNSNNKYDSMNFNDIIVKDLNLQAEVFANINALEFELYIDSLFFKPNLNKFKLNNLSGNFQLSEKFAEVTDLSIITNSSNLDLSARLDSLNLFGEVDLYKFKDYPLTLSAKADPFTSTDLSSFLDAVDFMNGPIIFSLDAQGSFGKFKHQIEIKIDDTHITEIGSLKNLHNPKKLFIEAVFSNSTVAYHEIDSFLNGLELPSYPDLLVEDLNIMYEGEPLKFNAYGDGKIDDGEITFNSFMNMYPDLIEYDYQFTTNNINLNTTIGLNSNLNS